jgi:hypothetical protein
VGDLGARHLEVGNLSADGSRRWDGRFWVLVHPDTPPDPFSAPVARPRASHEWSERRTFGLGGVILAALVAIAVIVMPIPAPRPDSLQSALNEMAIVTELRSLFAFGLPVLILSIGRRGIDVQLLRAVLVAFILGAALVSAFWLMTVVFPIPINPRLPGLFAVLLGGLVVAVTAGPVLALFVILANLLWYRSFRSLRPQLGIFNRR